MEVIKNKLITTDEWKAIINGCIAKKMDGNFTSALKKRQAWYWIRNKKSTKDNEKIVSLTLKCSKHGKAPILPISEMALGFRHDDVSKTYESTYGNLFMCC